MKYLGFILLLFIAAPDQGATQGDKAKDSFEEIIELVENKNYEFVKRFSNETDFLRIQSEKAIADLPHFGRVISGLTTGGIRFDGAIEEYSVERNDRKNKVTVQFKVKDFGDTYTCTLLISSLDSVSLSIASNTRPIIYYIGSIQPIKSD